ncbi:thiamine phosphate synthase [Alkalibacillus aidingensis]|uniref:thiamine phosphate synthase n=1 Tax=Alkalibacillus aidingensis TaxID=2747607 RepID=UPI001661340C|nr:thiamine phosphate synthase [Alkalibacillus aidingensis]
MTRDLKQQLSLYLVMGSQNCIHDPVTTLEEAIKGGVTFFQYREKGEGARVGDERVQLGLRLKEVCHRCEIPFIVNDDLQLALELDADGLHIGQDDGDVNEIKRKLGEQKILGLSTHNVEEAVQANKYDVDYIGVGPMFDTKTKEDIEEVRGPVVVKEIREELPDIPLVGIGGINQGNAEYVTNAGANGVAVISAISKAKSPKYAAKEFNK